STMLREMFAKNIEPTYFLPQNVIDYIKTEKLYKKR
ncbi:MAG: nicotinate-nucleotide adenylyltransferase, partial [Lactococcus lactis]|nr:nicotinate-nucleotide adenylyltransferase [Lactococcus lactis]MDN5948837.1 nicotinate-nucleotide adenylyltransferase [Lactococcus lactis]MDN6033376.1 nicotinate-nucleotide adenylyltransferase [Lactococcus lactis]MDN6074886.1 nicotinate-nucleotide adenylyltransferase [Lactococcus lactis]MDN6505272.1 nicotinate-nucleotide adenylyltransferase [Lactococcus lactis]